MPEHDPGPEISEAAPGRPLLAIVVLALSFLPLAPGLYFLVYVLRGCPQAAFYEFGGYIMIHFVLPLEGVFAGLGFGLVALGLKRMKLVVSYGACVALLFLLNVLFG